MPRHLSAPAYGIVSVFVEVFGFVLCQESEAINLLRFCRGPGPSRGFPMSTYRFSQMVYAICRISPDGLTERDVTFRLKRLLALDRKLSGPHFAFFDARPPGRGVDVQFSGYEAFALFLANSMLDHGLPQLTVVRLLRRARPQLALAHEKNMRTNPAKRGVKPRRPPGGWDLDAGATFVVVGLRDSTGNSDDMRPCAVCFSHPERVKFTRKYVQPGVGFSFFPLEDAMDRLTKEMANAPVRHRGRQPSA